MSDPKPISVQIYDANIEMAYYWAEEIENGLNLPRNDSIDDKVRFRYAAEKFHQMLKENPKFLEECVSKATNRMPCSGEEALRRFNQAFEDAVRKEKELRKKK